MIFSRISLVCCLIFLGSVSAFAEELVVLNHSFEMPVANLTNETPLEWTASSTVSTVWTENSELISLVNGDLDQYAGMNRSDGYIYQDLGVAFLPDTTYSIEVATAHRSGHLHAVLEFGLFSSSDIGTDLGTAGFSAMQSVWVGSGNPDADNALGLFRDIAELDAIGTGSLAEPFSYSTSSTPPEGNVVVFMRIVNTLNSNRRVQFDNVRVTAVPVEVLFGDINGDGAVNLLDIAPFVELLSSGEFLAAGDMNGDGAVDLLDVALFVELFGN